MILVFHHCGLFIISNMEFLFSWVTNLYICNPPNSKIYLSNRICGANIQILYNSLIKDNWQLHLKGQTVCRRINVKGKVVRPCRVTSWLTHPLLLLIGNPTTERAFSWVYLDSRTIVLSISRTRQHLVRFPDLLWEVDIHGSRGTWLWLGNILQKADHKTPHTLCLHKPSSWKDHTYIVLARLPKLTQLT